MESSLTRFVRVGRIYLFRPSTAPERFRSRGAWVFLSRSWLYRLSVKMKNIEWQGEAPNEFIELCCANLNRQARDRVLFKLHSDMEVDRLRRLRDGHVHATTATCWLSENAFM